MTIQEMAQVMMDLAADEQAARDAAERTHADDVDAFSFGGGVPQMPQLPGRPGGVGSGGFKLPSVGPYGSDYMRPGKLMVCKGCHGG